MATPPRCQSTPTKVEDWQDPGRGTKIGRREQLQSTKLPHRQEFVDGLSFRRCMEGPWGRAAASAGKVRLQGFKRYGEDDNEADQVMSARAKLLAGQSQEGAG